MQIFTSYATKTKPCKLNRVYHDTTDMYRKAVGFFIDVCLSEWEEIITHDSRKRNNFIESITAKTKNRPVVKYDFDKDFHKFPCYLRRSAVACAVGKVSSYKSALKNWEQVDTKARGKKPGIPTTGYEFPVFYKGNSLEYDGGYSVKIKVFIRNTWDWATVPLRKSDVDYIKHHCSDRERCSPTIVKSHKKWRLLWSFKETVTLNDKPVNEQRIAAVDLGINNACVISVMESDGTVVGRKFLKLSAENDSLNHALGKLKRAQKHGAGHMPRLWAFVNGINHDIAAKTANFIVETARAYHTDVIVMEHLDVNGRKHGRRKQRLHLWKAQYVQAMAINKAHRNKMHVSTVNAWNTSRLAFDGSGRILRGNESTKTNKNYSLCEFSTGKVYHCDLNASCNIGARYFIRELTKSLPAKERQQVEAKVPLLVHRSQSTLSTLISLHAALAALAASQPSPDRMVEGQSDAPKGQPVQQCAGNRKHSTLVV